MSSHDQPDDRLADAVNQEPIVYADCTQSELLFAIGSGAVIGLTLGVIIGIAIGFFMLGIIIGLFIGVGITWVTMESLKYIRQKFYLTWLKEKLFVIKHLFFGGYPFVSETKRYSKGARRG
jgi:conjugative transfer region protein (TIGR03750 family)